MPRETNANAALWRQRLLIYKEEVTRTIQEVKVSNPNDSMMARKKLKILSERLIQQTNACLSLPNCPLNEGDMNSLTLIQMEADLLALSQDPIPQQSQHGNNVNLPKLQIPMFDGDLLKWPEFWDRFESSVGSLTLKDADKLSYLASSLEGEAKETISGLPTTNENYRVAVELLKKQYGKPGVTIDAHYKAMNELKRNGDTPRQCRDTLNNIEKHLRILENLGENINHNHLRSIITSKFPDDILYELRTNFNQLDESSVKTIREQLEHIINAKVDSQSCPPVSVEALHIRETRSNDRERRTQKRVQQSHEVTQDSQAKKRKTNTCVFCGSQHFSDQCQKYTGSKRMKLLQDQMRCFKCLSKGHVATLCKRTKPCFYCKSDRHHSAVCLQQTSAKNDTKKEPPKTHNLFTSSSRATILQTAIIKVQNHEDKVVTCRALLDTGSQRSYMTQRLAERLSPLKVNPESLTVFTFGSSKPQELSSQCTEILLNNVPMRVNIIPFITEEVQPPSDSLIRSLPKQYADNLADNGALSNSVDILIGVDYYNTFVFQKKYQHQAHLHLVDSAFGWILSGINDQEQSGGEKLSIVTFVQDGPMVFQTDTSLDDPLKYTSMHKLWDLDTLGITDNPKATRDEEAIEKFNKSVEFRDGRYWVKWPWSQQQEELPENQGLAYGRLVSLLKRIDHSTLKKYDAVIQEQIERNVIEVIEEHTTSNKTHYLPHHHVVKEDKLRIVYDASSKSKEGKSLNECLHRGPVLLEDLVGLIIQFRGYKYGILADVEKAFLQLGLQLPDRDVTRFLWVRDIQKPVTHNNLIHLRFARVPFGISCSPFLLAVTLKHHLQKINTPVSNELARTIYVDNLMAGGETIDECLQLYRETNKIFKDISMNMRQWCTNNLELKKAILDDKKGTDEVITNVLGINWSPEQDTLSLKNFNQTVEGANTKRQVLKCIASIYDPCGFVSPLLIAAKIFLQQLWKEKLQWDTPLPKDLKNKWLEAAQCLLVSISVYIKTVQVPRWYGLNRPLRETSIELHCYTDVSAQAYAAVVYIKVKEAENSKVSLIISKTRLKPLKKDWQNTTPRMELMGVLIGCRLLKYVKTHLSVENASSYLWTDSQVVLCWIHSTKVLPPFVSGRITEIKKSNKEVEFKYTHTDENPADMATRECRHLQDIWLHGPKYLTLNKEFWPKEKTEISLCTIQADNIKMIKELQHEHFPDEAKGKKTDQFRTLELFLDGGILRVGGRFKQINWPEDKKYPILIPKNCDFTEKLIAETHKKLYHVGVAQTLANIRQNYWIPQGRSKVQQVLKKCLPCLKYGGGPYKAPMIAPLPKERIEFSPPFSYTGIDYLGPVYVATTEKRWLCLFTCLAVRAVHLEVVTNLTAEECVMAFRRFIATRGTPLKVISDNATYFKLTKEIFASEYCVKNNIQWKFIPELAPWFGGVYERLVGLIKHCMKRTIDKHTLTDTQLQTVTKEIEAVLNCRPLIPVGSELEHVLVPADFLCLGGSRSVTMETSEKEYLEPRSDIAKCLIEQWKRGLKLLEEFKNMFINQYLQCLRERYSSIRQPRVTWPSRPNIGDTVQIKDDGPRVNWKVGKVCRLERSEDGEIRVAGIKVGEKEFTRSITHLYPLEIREDTFEEEPTTNDDQIERNEAEGEMDGQAVKEMEYPSHSESTDQRGEEIQVEVKRGTREAAKKAKDLIRVWTD